VRTYKIYWFIVVCDIPVALLFFINILFLPPFFVFIATELFWALKGSGIEFINYFFSIFGGSAFCELNIVI